ncbi:MAG TPA: tRNA (adenosine(37)-N6)-threonylcarbamoyltransferase complex ATPase subunit type 1 TsaE [Spirochaetota bacterium]|nr:tRNA (adenosine(37)-N6)-threonylcarbamoyltransferase complex ATPase subunit type 1 TsaE [Spirochaetota bacterium]
MRRRTLISRSEEETLGLGKELGQSARRGTVYALCGDLGSGKTVLARGIARGLGITDDITSPTFTLLEIYDGGMPLYHFDLYRIEKAAEFDTLGFEEYWEGDGVSVIEWAERAEGLLPDSTVAIFMEYCGENERKISIEYPGD